MAETIEDTNSNNNVGGIASGGGGGSAGKKDLMKSIESSSLSVFTKRNYLQKGCVLLKLINKPLEYIIENPKPVIKKITDTYPIVGSRKTFYTFILAIFRYNPELKSKHKQEFELWSKEFTECDGAITDRYKENAPTKKQIEGYVKYEDIIKKRDSLDDGSDDKLLLSLYTYIPPLRADFGKVYIRGNGVGTGVGTGAAAKKEENYISDLNGSKPELVLGKYKTAKSHKEFRKELPKELVSQIKKSLERKERDYLFTMRDGEPMLKNTYTKWSNRIFAKLFKKPLTVSLIRHSFINTLDFNKLTIREKEDIAADMTHTANMQDKYRLIFDDASHK